jgi:hypothetical protein
MSHDNAGGIVAAQLVADTHHSNPRLAISQWKIRELFKQLFLPQSL